MDIQKWCIKIFFLFLCVSFFFNEYLINAQEHEKIIETVDVSNIEVAVRVFDGKQAVGGLKKGDFQLYLNGKKKNINGFYETRKKLKAKNSLYPGEENKNQIKEAPRFFLFIFNISTFNQDLKSILDEIFQQVIQPHDRLMVITNRFFLPEWECLDAESSKTRILGTIEKEVEKIKFELLFAESQLSVLARSFIYDLKNMEKPTDGEIIMVFNNFFYDYQMILNEIKKEFLDIPVDQYIKISQYLKSVPLDKWVLSFYQMGRLPLLKTFGGVQKILNSYLDGIVGSTSLVSKIRDLYNNYIFYNFMVNDEYFKDICNSFLNSGAVVHTQLLLPRFRFYSMDFQYQNVSTHSESILKKLSHLTGGEVLRSNRTNTFINKISQAEDIVYFVSYSPNNKNKEKLDIKVNNKDYRVVFDNQVRLGSFKSMVAKVNQNQKKIEIESIFCKNRLLLVRLNNIHMVNHEKEKFGAVEARIKIMDKNNRLISSFDKTFKGSKESSMFQTHLPELDKGEYNVVVEVTDLFALTRYKAGDAITIHQY